MRIKINFELLDKPNNREHVPNEYFHALLMQRLSDKYVNQVHDKKQHYTLFTYSSPKIDEDNGYVVFSGLSDTVTELVSSFNLDKVFRLGGYLCKLTEIETLEEPTIINNKLFIQGKVLASNKSRTKAIRDKEKLSGLLSNIANNKLEYLGKENVKFEVLKVEEGTNYYKKKGAKQIHLPASYIHTVVEGEAESLKTLLAIGVGQNTGAGCGLMKGMI